MRRVGRKWKWKWRVEASGQLIGQTDRQPDQTESRQDRVSQELRTHPLRCEAEAERLRKRAT